MSNSDFDKKGIDSYGIHWLQYAAFAVSGFAIFTTWGFFYDERFHNFVMNILGLLTAVDLTVMELFKILWLIQIKKQY